MGAWIDDDLYRTIQASIPIACVDVLPVRRNPAGQIEIGLILRDTPHQGRRWCLVGGRVRHGETLDAAIRRHFHETLRTPGGSAPLSLNADPIVVEYAPGFREDAPHDPRQHSIAVTYVGQTDGAFTPGGEAHEFRWFSPTDALAPGVMGFGQEFVARRLLDTLGG